VTGSELANICQQSHVSVMGHNTLGASIWLMQSYEFDIQDGHNTCEWATYILMPRVRAMEMQGQRISGVYKDSKHNIGGQQSACNNYYKEKKGQGLMGTHGGFFPHHQWGGYPDAHQVLVLAQNTEMGMDSQCTYQ